MVESLDGNRDVRHVNTVLGQLVPSVSFTNENVTSIDQFDGIDLNDDRIFPGYDAFWILRPGTSSVERPSFHTYLGAESQESYPFPNRSQVASWEPVFEWMRKNGAIAGFATAAKTLTIEDVRVLGQPRVP